MRLIIAQNRLKTPGGSETFALTIAENIAKLGHEVVIWTLKLGVAAQLAEERAIPVFTDKNKLPQEADATLALDRTMAIDLAQLYPQAVRLYAMHHVEEVWLPPPQPGIVAATLAPNSRLELLAKGCIGAGEVIRIRQPIDMARFGTRGWARALPERVLIVGNHGELLTQRIDQLQRAWSHANLEWRRLGSPSPSLHVAPEMAAADIVVGYGRSILEAMCCSRPAYVHDHSGSDGWVTTDNYADLEADGFAGTALRATPSLTQLEEDFKKFDPELGRGGLDLVRKFHDARIVAAEIVELITQLGSVSGPKDRSSLHALSNLAGSLYRANADVAMYRKEAQGYAEARRADVEKYKREVKTLRSRIESRIGEVIRRGVHALSKAVGRRGNGQSKS